VQAGGRDQAIGWHQTQDIVHIVKPEGQGTGSQDRHAGGQSSQVAPGGAPSASAHKERDNPINERVTDQRHAGHGGSPEEKVHVESGVPIGDIEFSQCAQPWNIVEQSGIEELESHATHPKVPGYEQIQEKRMDALPGVDDPGRVQEENQQ